MESGWTDGMITGFFKRGEFKIYTKPKLRTLLNNAQTSGLSAGTKTVYNRWQ